MGETQSSKTRANHGIVFNGTLQASDDILEAIEEHSDAELVYQNHSAGKLYITDESEDE